MQKINNVKVSICIEVISTEGVGTQLAGGRGGLLCPKSKSLILYPYFGCKTLIIQGPHRRELPRKCCFKACRNVKMQKSLPSNNDVEATFCTFQPVENPQIAKDFVR